MKYAECDLIKIKLYKTDSYIQFQLSDNGKGFNYTESNSQGIGLKNMRIRTEMIGGKFLLHSSQELINHGTTLTIKLDKI